MTQTTIQFHGSSQGVIRLCLFYLLGLFTWGCEASPEERILGHWVVDSEATLAHTQFDTISAPASAAVKPLAVKMFGATRFEIQKENCVRMIGPLVDSFPCRPHHTSQRDVVSLESRDRQGRRTFIRARPIDGRLELEIDGHMLLMKREAPSP